MQGVLSIRRNSDEGPPPQVQLICLFDYDIWNERRLGRVVCIHLKYFPRLRKRFRSSNLLERSLEEVKRRTKVIRRFPRETSRLVCPGPYSTYFWLGPEHLA